MFLPVNITLQFGDTGEFVAELQRRLSLINLFNESFINATFDGNTVNAVKSFQSMQGLRVDGIAGPETLRRLNGALTGDSGTTSSSGSNQEEEQKQVQQTALLVDAIYADTQAIDPTLTGAPAVEEKREAPAEKPAVAAAPPPRENTAETQQRNTNLLADMLMQQPAQQQSVAPAQPTAGELQQQQLAALKQQELATKAQEQPKPIDATAKPKDETKPKEQQEVAERKPLSALLQRLVDYVESKLPKSVVNEVKEIGQTMLKAGVREAAMPDAAGPAAPAVEAGRGAQQQPQQRG